LSDVSNLTRIVQEVQPDEVYNFGAQSHVAVSFESPEYTADVDGMGTCGYWRLSACWGWRKRHAFTKIPPVSFMVRFKKPQKKKPPSFLNV
jgi:GDPmannose 4,6-dehydratase